MVNKQNQVYLLEDNNKDQKNFGYEYPEQDPHYTGQELDDELKEGPIEDRQCRDILFIFLYAAVWFGMGYVSYQGYKYGNPQYLLSPWDMNGNHCGYGVTKDFPNIFIISSSKYYCVTNCPSEIGQILTCYNCGSETAMYTSQKFVTLCYPDAIEEQDMIANIVHASGMEKFIGDLDNSKELIAGSAVMAFIISLLLTFLIKYTARCVVWSMIFIYLALLGGIGTVAYLQTTTEYFQEYKYVQNEDHLRIIAYTLWTIGVLSLLITLCLCNKINQCISILKAASDFTRDLWLIIFVPIGVFCLVVAFIAFWVVGSVYIYSQGTIVKSDSSPFPALDYDNGRKYQLLLMLFGMFWNCEFCLALCQFIISSSACMWYFSHLGKTLSFPISKSLCRGLTYHFGSLLFGSLILAIIQIVKIILDQIHKAMKQPLMNDSVGNNALMRCTISYCKCLVKCFERVVRFISQNAYTMMALSGKGFCASAYDAFYLISRNITKVAITHGLGKLFQVIGTLFVCASTSSISYLILTQSQYFQHELVSPLAPIIAIAIVSFLIGALFMDLFGMGSDAILMCYLADQELYKAEGGPKSMPNSLKEFLEEY